ncbi:NAD(P)H nitroreductase [Virgisporangium aliadipatigenens]|uniref:NAD(P)H nitroreductase n=1 Tax=Virgisporangium aliadipatigenens TaxID=741659 RepID=A0A8J3YKI6_9ACTN|nr:nitroreductase [Virgisporangium aliadipatigenens]GIJ46876.1 NAD(P)H nitroreductase [Virgisporangium aliadipatigenens]
MAVHIAGPGVRHDPVQQALTGAAVNALSAPSVFNTQPWRWHIAGDTAELWADRSRQLTTVDPDGRLLLISCGAALHHFRTAFAARGRRAAVERRPDPARPDLLAVLRGGDITEPDPSDVRLLRAMSIRRADRRPFADRPVPLAAFNRVRAVDVPGVHVHTVRPEQVVTLTVAAGHAAARELSDEAYREELRAWRERGENGVGDGVPASSAGPRAGRPVPVRDFAAAAPDAQTLHDAVSDGDRFARYLIVWTDSDGPAAWLAAGEALSEVLLQAASEGLAASPMSDLVEVPASHALVRELLGGIGYPAIAVRVGVPAREGRVGSTLRRSPTAAITVES